MCCRSSVCQNFNFEGESTPRLDILEISPSRARGVRTEDHPSLSLPAAPFTSSSCVHVQSRFPEFSPRDPQPCADRSWIGEHFILGPGDPGKSKAKNSEKKRKEYINYGTKRRHEQSRRVQHAAKFRAYGSLDSSALRSVNGQLDPQPKRCCWLQLDDCQDEDRHYSLEPRTAVCRNCGSSSARSIKAR